MRLVCAPTEVYLRLFEGAGSDPKRRERERSEQSKIVLQSKFIFVPP